MASVQAFGTTSSWVALVGSGDGSLWECKSKAGSKTVSALYANPVDDVEHMIIDCVEWQIEAPVVVCTWTSCFGRLFHPGPNRIGCFCARLLQGLQRVISDSSACAIHPQMFSSLPGSD